MVQAADHIILPTYFKLFSYNNDLTATFQYKFNDIIYHILYKINNRNGVQLFFELFNGVHFFIYKMSRQIVAHVIVKILTNGSPGKIYGTYSDGKFKKI